MAVKEEALTRMKHNSDCINRAAADAYLSNYGRLSRISQIVLDHMKANNNEDDNTQNKDYGNPNFTTCKHNSDCINRAAAEAFLSKRDRSSRISKIILDHINSHDKDDIKNPVLSRPHSFTTHCTSNDEDGFEGRGEIICSSSSQKQGRKRCGCCSSDHRRAVVILCLMNLMDMIFSFITLISTKTPATSHDARVQLFPQQAIHSIIENKTTLFLFLGMVHLLITVVTILSAFNFNKYMIVIYLAWSLVHHIAASILNLDE